MPWAAAPAPAWQSTASSRPDRPRDALADDGADVLDQLDAVVADDAGEVDALGTGGLDPLTDRLVARGLRVPRLEALDVDVDLVRPRPERVGDTFPERLVVVEDVDALLFFALSRSAANGPW